MEKNSSEFEDSLKSVNKDYNLNQEKRNENNDEVINLENDNKLKIQKLSKNQIKKQKKQEEWEKKMYEIKKYKKEKKKEKKRIKREQKEEQEKLNPSKENVINNTNIENIKDIPFKTRKEIKDEFKQKCRNGVRVVIDCDFEHLMNDASNKSMVRQIIYLYCVNKRSKNPFRLILYGVGKKILEGLKISDYNNWIGIEVYLKEDYPSFETFIQEILYKDDQREMTDIKNNIYYLSADSENNIDIIDNNATYIIGGIVDRNKYKNLTLNKAKQLGINHGKFPIGNYLKLNSSQVLTTNHTFQILNEYSIRHDWKEAFISVIPKRKQEYEKEGNEEKNNKENFKEKNNENK